MTEEQQKVETLVIGDISLQSTRSNLKELKGLAKSLIKDKAISGYLQQKNIQSKVGTYIN